MHTNTNTKLYTTAYKCFSQTLYGRLPCLAAKFAKNHVFSLRRSQRQNLLLLLPATTAMIPYQQNFPRHD